jgi:hypothetical protein
MSKTYSSCRLFSSQISIVLQNILRAQIFSVFSAVRLERALFLLDTYLHCEHLHEHFYLHL